MRMRQVLATVTVLALLGASVYAFWTPTHQRDLVIAPTTGPIR